MKDLDTKASAIVTGDWKAKQQQQMSGKTFLELLADLYED